MAEEGGWLGTLVSLPAPTSDGDESGGHDGTSTVLGVADVGPAVSAGGCLSPQCALATLPRHAICGVQTPPKSMVGDQLVVIPHSQR